jgi:hypothetical protein
MVMRMSHEINPASQFIEIGRIQVFCTGQLRILAAA